MENGAIAATHGAAHEQAEYPPGLLAPSRRARSAQLIGEVIVELGFARHDAVEAAVALSREQGRTTGQLLVEAGELRPDQLARALAERFGVDYVDLSVFEVDEDALALIDVDLARRYQAVPIGFLSNGTVILAMADPTNVLTLDELSMMTGRKMRPAGTPKQDLGALLARLNTLDDSMLVNPSTAEVREIELALDDGPDKDAPVVKLVQQIISQAVEAGASDIHCDPQKGDMEVHFRIDGVLTRGITVPQVMSQSVVSRIKIMAGVDIAERRRPQDGRMQVKVAGRVVDVRVATLPLINGEGVVMRILDTQAVVRDLVSLGMPDAERGIFETAITKPYGAVLVTGPTGSGKSTTLYGALSVVNDGQRSIFTIEDPVESPIGGIKQMQVAIKAGVTFAAGLRSILRSDPDVIMVGEIRDRETAEIAIQAALTGHLMLSTLHTRDAASALTRLVDMGIEPFMVAAAIDCVVAQRLARVLCAHCKRPTTVPETVLAEQGLDGATVYEAAGCIRCGDTGYSGRLGLYEVMPVGEQIRSLLLDHRSVEEIGAAATGGGMRTMREDGIAKVRAGMTSLVEVTRVTKG
jgi:type IV pilus assembly protein PilB